MDEDRSVQTLQGLLDISRALGSEVALDSLLSVIIKRASLIMEADRTTVFVMDHSTNRLWSRVGEGLDAGTIELEVGSGIAGEVARTGEAINIPNAQTDARFNPEFDRKTGYVTRSVLCGPIRDADGHLVGVIQSINKKTGKPFDAEDERVMDALASHVGVALERAQLTEAYLEKKRFDEALKLASEIQMGMLPKRGDRDTLENGVGIGATLRPARHVGGDFYDYRVLDDGRLFFCIGDVSGKGVPAALMMAVTRTLFRSNAYSKQDPAAILRAVNRQLCEELSPSMFVTAFCGVLDPRTGGLSFSNAGHNPPILYSAEALTAAEVSAKPGMALGVAEEYEYENETAELKSGDMIVLYTDGISDAIDEHGSMFSTPRLVDLVPSIANESPAAMVDLVLSAVDDFAGNRAQFDDLTCLCIRQGSPVPGDPD